MQKEMGNKIKLEGLREEMQEEMETTSLKDKIEEMQKKWKTKAGKILWQKCRRDGSKSFKDSGRNVEEMGNRKGLKDSGRNVQEEMGNKGFKDSGRNVQEMETQKKSFQDSGRHVEE